MSKYIEDFEKQFKDICAVKRATKEAVAKGDKIAFKDIPSSPSLKRLMEKLKEINNAL